MASDPIKVLLFSGRFELRGSSAYTLRLAEKLQEHDVEPQVLCADARAIELTRRSRLPLVSYPRLTSPGLGWVVTEVIRRDLAANPPDLIHIQSRRMLSKGAWLAHRLERPFVLTVHDYLSTRERLRINTRWGRQIVAVSESVRDDLLASTNLSTESVTVIQSGVERPQSVEALPVLDPGHTPVVGTAGPLETIKGLPFFLGAAQKVLATRPDAQFLISGTGPEEVNLRRLARDLNIAEQVTFVPNLSDFSASLAAMDIFCLPSLRQGLGTIMLEAMTLARPVIATGVGGVYAIVRDQETGLMVPPSDSGALARRIIELLDDPVKARSIGEAGRRLVESQFGVDEMVKQTAELYRRVLEAE